jgi:hypothetical protein
MRPRSQSVTPFSFSPQPQTLLRACDICEMDDWLVLAT